MSKIEPMSNLPVGVDMRPEVKRCGQLVAHGHRDWHCRYPEGHPGPHEVMPETFRRAPAECGVLDTETGRTLATAEHPSLLPSSEAIAAYKADPSFETVNEALKAARDEHADALAEHVPPKYGHTSKLRHWWESKKGEWRHQLRDWLGVTEVVINSVRIEDMAGRAAFQVEQVRADHDQLRHDFNDGTGATTDIFRQHEHRIKQAEGNLHTLIGQFHSTSTLHAEMLSAFRTVPMNAVAHRKFVEQKRINAERRQKKVAGSIAPAETLVPTEGVTRQADELVAEVPDMAPVTVPPNGEIHPGAEPIQQPQSD